MSAPVLRVLGDSAAERRRWDAFVHAEPEAGFFHLSGWREVIRNAFGHRSWFCYAEQDGAIRAVLPLAEIRSRLFGHAIVSLPFCVYGGVAGDCPASRRLLLGHAQALARESGAAHLELRQAADAAELADWPRKDLYFTFRKPIGADEQANLSAIPRKQRAVVRKSLGSGLQCEIDAGVQRFYAAYSASVHRLGTPVLPRRYFALLKEEFGDACELRVVTQGGKTIAGVMSFYFRGEVLPYYGGGLDAARGIGANDYMYWTLMRDAGALGCTMFDFGRSKAGTGSFAFKKNWGFEPTPLPYAYWLARRSEVPDVNPLNPRYRLLIRMWRSMPLRLANIIGPHIARNLG